MKKIERRSFCKALLAGGTALTLAACGLKAGSEPADSSVPAASSSGAASGGTTEIIPILSPEEYPRVDGSTACIPLMAEAQHRITGDDLLDIQTGISVSTTGFAWQYMGLYYEKQDLDRMILVVYEAPAYIQQQIADAGTELEVTPIGRDALVFMVNEQNPVQSLSRQQLVDIYTGKITNWKQVGGADSPIVAFQRSEDSGSQTMFQKLVMGDTQPMAAPTELAPGAMAGLVDALAEYNNQGNALGFSVYYYIDQMYQKPGLRLIAVDGVLPANDTIADQSYPYCNEFFAVIHKNAAQGSPARTVYDWLCGPEGAQCIRDTGYVPARTI
ncbi:MAG: substrate-binding domain-containing protein [Faecalibacterium sp.]|nr:substrate-binding domain-containing protein [Faecalibacterium sp.]